MKKVLLNMTFALTVLSANCQETVFEDSSVVEEIKKISSSIYENKDKTYFFLTKEQLHHEKTYGTSLVVHSKDNIVNRLITISFTENGQLSGEFYFQNSQLIYLYQTFEYFSEIDVKGSWKNFKGNSGWESRYYFVNEKLKFARHKGKKNKINAEYEKQLLSDSARILDYITAQIKE